MFEFFKMKYSKKDFQNSKFSFPFLIEGLYVEKLYYENLASKSATVTPVEVKVRKTIKCP